MATVEVRVNGLGGSLCVLTASSSDPVWDVKARVEASRGIPAREQRLVGHARIDACEGRGVVDEVCIPELPPVLTEQKVRLLR